MRFKLRAAVAGARRRPDTAPGRLQKRRCNCEQLLHAAPADRLDVLVADTQPHQRQALQPGDEIAVDLARMAEQLADVVFRLDGERVLAHLLVDIPGEQGLERPERQPGRGDAAAAVGAQQPAVQRRQRARPILQAGLAARW